MLVLVILLVAAFYLVIALAIANEFEKIAKEKGYSGYFAWCFWLGIVGWAMVIALPDRGAQKAAQMPAQGPQQLNSAAQSLVVQSAENAEPKNDFDELPEL